MASYVGQVIKRTEDPRLITGHGAFADDARPPSTLHVAAFDDDRIVAVATIAEEPHPTAPAAGDWRVRGMATAPDTRGLGSGGALLRALLDHARAHGGRRAWCTARITARAFYERWGFIAEGDEFELPHIGPHVIMATRLED